MIYVLQSSFSWYLDYYLERFSIKLADLFGAFSQLVIILFVILLFFSLLLWLAMPFIEISKRNLLRKIYYRLEETEKQLGALNRRLDQEDRLPDDFPREQ